MAKELVFATDTNILMQRARFVYKDLHRPDGHASGVVYGTLLSISKLLKRFNPDIYVPVFDVGKSDFRQKLDDDYKGNRGNKDTSLVNQFSAVRLFLDAIGMNVYYEQNVEADDLLAKLALHHCKTRKLIICTQDHDMFQLVRPNVSVFRPKMGKRSEQLFEYDEYKVDLGFEPSKIADVMAITGDGGDNVPGVKGYGWAKASKAIKMYGSVQGAIANDPKLMQYSEQCLLSKQLVTLDGKVATKAPVLKKYSEVLETIYDNEDAMDFLYVWGLKSMLRQYEKRTLFTP